MTAEELAQEIAQFLVDPRAIIFAGAGVGVRVGLPTWQQWLTHLATVCRKYKDRLAADLIEERVKEGDFLGAAVIYKTSQHIPAGQQLTEMAEPFWSIPGDLALLEALVLLPTSGLVTTNYDRSLHEACARFRGSAVRPLELWDATLRNGASISEPFIARIHGRAEMPDSMIVGTYDYERLEDNFDYQDFLMSVLRQRPTIFLGFSFLDPAITNILAFYFENFGPHFPTLHIALIPESTDPALQKALRAVNIRVLTYDSSDQHKDLWRAIRLAQGIDVTAEAISTATSSFLADLPQSQLHRVIAFAYARTKAPASASRPVLEMVQDGVLLSILNDEPSVHLEKATAVERLRDLLRVDEQTGLQLFETSLGRLKASGDVSETERYIRRRTRSGDELTARLNNLVRSVTNRMKVVYGKAIPREDENNIRSIWENLFIVRAWDLAPQYAGSVLSKGIEVEESVGALAAGMFDKCAGTARAVADTIVHIINYPEREEANALAEISRAAITVQLLLSSPRSALAHAYTLPGKIYFDASVLLPAIVPGHPIHTGNISAINHLQDAAKNAGRRCDLAVTYPFLEEILVHRTNAIELVRELKLEEPENIAEHVVFYGAERTNVFVGAFASQFTDTPPVRKSFAEFLGRVAPYTNHKELISFLSTRHIASETLDYSVHHNVEFNHIFSDLLDGYELDSLLTGRDKDRILIRHEAQQLTRLLLDARTGERSVFVTADRRLQRVVQETEHLQKLSGNVLSHIGFIGLVDLLVGLSPDKEVFTRLVWATPRSTVQKQLRDYLVRITLRKYDHAMAMAMPAVLDEVLAVADLDSTAHRRFGKPTDIEDAKKTTEFLDRIENQYFEHMRAAIEKSEKSVTPR
jgi:hypothetical protein